MWLALLRLANFSFCWITLGQLKNGNFLLFIQLLWQNFLKLQPVTKYLSYVLWRTSWVLWTSVISLFYNFLNEMTIMKISYPFWTYSEFPSSAALNWNWSTITFNFEAEFICPEYALVPAPRHFKNEIENLFWRNIYESCKIYKT